MQLEQNKQERKVKCRRQRLVEAERQFELKQQKKREKHKGHQMGESEGSGNEP